MTTRSVYIFCFILFLTLPCFGQSNFFSLSTGLNSFHLARIYVPHSKSLREVHTSVNIIYDLRKLGFINEIQIVYHHQTWDLLSSIAKAWADSPTPVTWQSLESVIESQKKAALLLAPGLVPSVLDGGPISDLIRLSRFAWFGGNGLWQPNHLESSNGGGHWFRGTSYPTLSEEAIENWFTETSLSPTTKATQLWWENSQEMPVALAFDLSQDYHMVSYLVALLEIRKKFYPDQPILVLHQSTVTSSGLEWLKKEPYRNVFEYYDVFQESPQLSQASPRKIIVVDLQEALPIYVQGTLMMRSTLPPAITKEKYAQIALQHGILPLPLTGEVQRVLRKEVWLENYRHQEWFTSLLDSSPSSTTLSEAMEFLMIASEKAKTFLNEAPLSPLDRGNSQALAQALRHLPKPGRCLSLIRARD